MSFKLNQTQASNQGISWARLQVSQAQYSQETQKKVHARTFRRMYLTVFVWFAAAFLLYCSLFYIGAFVDVGKVIGTSQSQRAIKIENSAQNIQAKQNRHLLSPISDALSINRVYLRKGQIVQAAYSLPDGTQMSLKIKQCKSQPILEIFTCKFLGEQEKLIRNGNTGVVKFLASEPGFYYFEDEVTQLPGTVLKPNYDYIITWQRA